MPHLICIICQVVDIDYRTCSEYQGFPLRSMRSSLNRKNITTSKIGLNENGDSKQSTGVTHEDQICQNRVCWSVQWMLTLVTRVRFIWSTTTGACWSGDLNMTESKRYGGLLAMQPANVRKTATWLWSAGCETSDGWQRINWVTSHGDEWYDGENILSIFTVEPYREPVQHPLPHWRNDTRPGQWSGSDDSERLKHAHASLVLISGFQLGTSVRSHEAEQFQ